MCLWVGWRECVERAMSGSSGVAGGALEVESLDERVDEVIGLGAVNVED